MPTVRTIDRPKIFLALPSYDRRIDLGAAAQFINLKLAKNAAGEILLAPYDLEACGGQGSLIGDSFNRFWCDALNRRESDGITHFAMLHSDIHPMRPDWLLALVHELAIVDADVISQVIAIKNTRGDTSAAWCPWPHEPLGRIPANYRERYDQRAVRNITNAELANLPRTWSAASLGRAGERLLMNTGMWVADIRRPVFGGRDVPYFSIDTWLTREADGNLVKHCLPEDWHFALQVADLGGKVCCTQIAPAVHYGGIGFQTHRMATEEEAKTADVSAAKEVA